MIYTAVDSYLESEEYSSNIYCYNSIKTLATNQRLRFIIIYNTNSIPRMYY